MDAGNKKAVIAALLANSGIAVAKFVAYGFTGSSSMLAEGVHSVADSGNQALLLWGSASARRPPTRQHPFGHGRERYFWSFIVALILFAMGSVFAIYEGIHKLLHPEPLSAVRWAVGVLLLGMLLEGYSFKLAVTQARRKRGRQSWMSYLRGTKDAELSVILLEDLGALLGLMIALAGVSLAWYTGDARFDGAASIVIGLLLGVIAVLLAVEMKSLIIGEAATPADQEQIVSAIEDTASVQRLISMRTQHMGPDQLLVAAKVEFDPGLSIEELATVINLAETRVRESVPIATVVYLEPDVWDEARVGEGQLGTRHGSARLHEADDA